MPATKSHLHSHRWAAAFAAGLLASAALLAGCGISYGDNDKSTELFKSLTVAGDLVPGGHVSIRLVYAQPYASAINVACVLIAKGGQDGPAPTPLPAMTPEEPGATPTPPAIPAPVPTPRHTILNILEEPIRGKAVETPIEYSTPEPGSLTGEFTVPQASGPYEVRCYTPADLNNRITKNISIASQ